MNYNYILDSIDSLIKIIDISLAPQNVKYHMIEIIENAVFHLKLCNFERANKEIELCAAIVANYF